MTNLGFPNIASFPKVWYVSTTGNDTTGDGSLEKPYASLDKAVVAASSGHGIKILAGTYNFPYVAGADTGSSTIINDRGKALTIWGENDRTIINCNGAVATTRDGNVIMLGNALSVLQNLKINYAPGKTYSYSNAIFLWSLGSICNVLFENTGALPWSYSYYNSGPTSSPKVTNCVFKTNGKGKTTDFSGSPKYINCLFDVSSTPTSIANSSNNLTRAIITTDYSKPLTADLINTGLASILNPDGSRSNIGLCGGPFDWSFTAYTYLINYNNRILKSFSGNWVDLCAKNELTESIFKSNGMTMDDLSQALPLINQIGNCELIALGPAEVPSVPIRKLNGVPKPKLILANGGIPLISIQCINQVTMTTTTAGSGLIRFIVSADNGNSWAAYSNSVWTPIDISDFSNVKLSGMTPATLNALSKSNWSDFINPINAKSLRFGYYLEVSDSVDTANADAISLNVDMLGAWMNSKEADWGYVNKTIARVLLYSTGDYKINY